MITHPIGTTVLTHTPVGLLACTCFRAARMSLLIQSCERFGACLHIAWCINNVRFKFIILNVEVTSVATRIQSPNAQKSATTLQCCRLFFLPMSRFARLMFSQVSGTDHVHKRHADRKSINPSKTFYNTERSILMANTFVILCNVVLKKTR